MTNQPTDNEWIEQARLTYNEIPIWWKECKDEETAFKQAILYNLPKPTEVVSPVDIDEILNEYFTDTMRGTPRVELERILRKHLKGTQPVEPINQERLSELIEHIIWDFFDRHRLSYSTFDVDNEYSKRKADELVPALREICWEYLGKSLQSESEQSQAEKVVEIKYVIRKCVCKTTLWLSDNYCPNCWAKIKWIA